MRHRGSSEAKGLVDVCRLVLADYLRGAAHQPGDLDAWQVLLQQRQYLSAADALTGADGLAAGAAVDRKNHVPS